MRRSRQEVLLFFVEGIVADDAMEKPHQMEEVFSLRVSSLGGNEAVFAVVNGCDRIAVHVVGTIQ